MTLHYSDEWLQVHHGDCLEVMAGMEPESVDAVVTDPPYGLEFMGRAWDRLSGGVGIDAAFGHWLAGFTDGEGCFSVHKKPQATLDCQFSITLRADDMPVLERCKRQTGLGTLAIQRPEGQNPKARWTVSSKADCAALRDLFRAFPLRAKKAREFEEWSVALDEWLRHERGEWEGMEASRDRLMAMRDYDEGGVRIDPMQMWHYRWAREAFRVAKPSAYLLAFGGTRTVHRMTVALEDAGWIIRDMLVWAYASGFPKSKASLKPAWEPIVMARKPGPLRMLAIDECRIPTDEEFSVPQSNPGNRTGIVGAALQPVTADIERNQAAQRASIERTQALGRWPANVILTDPIFDGGWDGVVGGGMVAGSSPIERPEGFQRFNGTDYNGGEAYQTGAYTSPGYGDSGTYSRFFLIPKADRADREPVLGGLPLGVRNITEGHGRGAVNTSKGDGTGIRENRPRANLHPTVKPVDLMRHLVRLVTPAGGVVLDPFLGSGTTGLAAEMEGFEWIGIEKEAEYVAIAEARLNGTQRGLGLPA
jgi:DNA modification methylase